jgi:hypothetical protein
LNAATPGRLGGNAVGLALDITSDEQWNKVLDEV